MLPDVIPRQLGNPARSDPPRSCFSLAPPFTRVSEQGSKQMAEPKIETDWREVGVMFGLAVVAASIVYAVGRYVERRRENPAAENRA